MIRSTYSARKKIMLVFFKRLKETDDPESSPSIEMLVLITPYSVFFAAPFAIIVFSTFPKAANALPLAITLL